MFPRPVRLAWIVLMVLATACRHAKDDRSTPGHTSDVPFTVDALVERAAAGDLNAVTALLDAGMDPNVTTDSGVSPLMAALQARKTAVACRLVERGAHSWTQDDKWSPLMFAAFLGELDVVQAMLARDANVTAANAQGMTALMFAASRGWTDIVNALTQKGAVLDARDLNGYTALMFAANNGHKASVEALLGAGADPSVRSESGQTAAVFARLNGFGEIAAVLQSTGADSQ